MINWLKQWTIIKKDDLDKYINLINEKNDTILNEKTLRNEVEARLDKFENKKSEWKLPGSETIFYSAPTSKKLTDYIVYREIIEITDVAKSLIPKITDLDSVPLVCEKWLEDKFKKNEFKYLAEKKEYWDTPEKVLKNKEADCDGFRFLLYYLIRQCFKQLGEWEKVWDRLFCVDGNTNQRGQMPDPGEIHAYIAWKAFKDDEFYTIESTYFRDHSIYNYLKLPQKRNTMYGMMRYIWTEEKMYRVHSFWF